MDSVLKTLSTFSSTVNNTNETVKTLSALPNALQQQTTALTSMTESISKLMAHFTNNEEVAENLESDLEIEDYDLDPTSMLLQNINPGIPDASETEGNFT